MCIVSLVTKRTASLRQSPPSKPGPDNQFHGGRSPSGSVRYETSLTLRSDYEYHAQVSYIKGIYNAVIRETRRGSSIGNTIAHKPFSSCKPGKSKGTN